MGTPRKDRGNAGIINAAGCSEDAHRRFLPARLGIAFAASLDYETTLRNVVTTVCEEFADFCILDIVGASGRLERRTAVAPALPLDEATLGAYVPAPNADRHPVNVALRTGQLRLTLGLDDTWAEDSGWSTGQLDTLRELGIEAAVHVPMIAEGERLGVITFGTMTGTGRTFSPEDLAHAEEIGRLAAVALSHARRFRELARSEARYREIIEISHEGVWIVDGDARTRYVNRRMAEMIGYLPDEMYGRRIFEFIETASRRDAVRAFALHRDGAAERAEARLVRKDGSACWAIIASTPLRDADGTFSGALGIVTDITERKAIETQYRLLAEATPQIVWIADASGAATYLNERWKALTGIARVDALGSGWQEAIHPADVPEVRSRWHAARTRGAEFEVECRLRRADDGSYRWHVLRALPRHDDGHIVEWHGTMSDIDATRRAADAMTFLSEASEALAASLDVERTFATLARLAVDAFADFCVVHLRADDGSPRLVAMAHVDFTLTDQVLAVLDSQPQEHETVARVIATAQPLFLPHNDAKLWPTLEARSVIVLPLIARGMTLGALTLVAATGARTFGTEDLRLAQLLAKRAAVAVDNARLYSEERRLARQRDAIARASEVLGRSLELDALMGDFAELLIEEIAEEATICLADGRTIVRARGAIGTNAPALSHPLRHRNADLGTVTVRGTWPFDEDAVSLLAELTSRAAVAVENAQLYEREHHVAVTLQRAMLPAELPKVAGFTFDAVYHPGAREAEIGGDWYDAIALPDGRVVLSIGDVTGRGLTAAVIMGRVRMAIETVAIYEPDPARLLDAADAVLRRAHPDAIVTALVAVLDPATQRFTYATAGHPTPLVRALDGTTRQLPGRGLPLGLRDGKATPPTSVVLPPGALIALFTDGLVESTRDITEGERRLFAALRDPRTAESPAPAAAIVDCVLHDGTHDDVAVMTARCEGGAAQDGEPWTLRWRFDPRDYRHARGVRETVVEALVLHGEGVDLPAAELVFGELVGNAARHAPGSIDVELSWEDPSTPVLHVVDQGPGFTAHAVLPPIESESGRGLYLVTQLTRAFSVTVLPERGARARAVLLTK